MVAAGAIIALVVLAMIIVLAVMSTGIKIITPYEQGIYMRLGRYIRVLNQGVNFVAPLISTVVKIDLRTQVLNIPRTQIATKDNRLIVANAIVYVKVIDPIKAFFQVTNYRSATVYLAQTTIKDMLGAMDLNEISSSRNVLDQRLKDKLDDAADQWGLKVDRVDLKEVNEDTSGDPIEPFASQDIARVQRRANDIGRGPREASGPRPWK